MQAAEAITERSLEVLSSTLDLPLPVQIAIGLALAFSPVTTVALSGFRFVRTKARSYAATISPADRLPFAVFHPLLFLLRTHPTSLAAAKETSDLIARLHAAHPAAFSALSTLPVIQGAVALVDVPASPAQTAAVQRAPNSMASAEIAIKWHANIDATAAKLIAGGTAALRPEVADGDPLLTGATPVPPGVDALAPLVVASDDAIGLILDLGPACTRSRDAFRATLAAAGRGPRRVRPRPGETDAARAASLVDSAVGATQPLSPLEIAEVLVGIANASVAGPSAPPSLPSSVAASFLQSVEASTPTLHRSSVATAGAASGVASPPGAADSLRWALDIVTAVLREDHAPGNWVEVAQSLDMPADATELFAPTTMMPAGAGAALPAGTLPMDPAATRSSIRSAEAFGLVARAYVACSGTPFPASVLLQRWRNAPAQLAAIEFAIGASPDLVSFAQCTPLMEPVEGSAGGCGTPNQAWCAPGLYATLSRLAHASGLLMQSLRLLEQGESRVPELVLLGLATAKAAAGELHPSEESHILRGRVYESLAVSTLRPALGVAPGAWAPVIRAGIVAGGADLPASPLHVTTVRRLLAISKVLAVNTIMHLAGLLGQEAERALGSRLSVDDTMRCRAVFVARGIALLRRAGASPLDILGNVTGPSSLVIAALGVLSMWDPSEPLAPMVAAAAPGIRKDAGVHMAVKDALSQWLSRPEDAGLNAIRTVIAVLRRVADANVNPSDAAGGAGAAAGSGLGLSQLLHPSVLLVFFRALHDAAVSQPADVSNAVRATFEHCCGAFPTLVTPAENRHTEEAQAIISSLYAGTITVDAVMKRLGTLREAPAGREVFTTVLHNLIEETQHADKYPLAQLRTTAELLGFLVRERFVSPSSTGHILRIGLESLRKPLESQGAVNLAKLSFWMLTISLPVLVDFKDFVRHLLRVPNVTMAADGPLAEFRAMLERIVASSSRGFPDITPALLDDVGAAVDMLASSITSVSAVGGIVAGAGGAAAAGVVPGSGSGPASGLATSAGAAVASSTPASGIVEPLGASGEEGERVDGATAPAAPKTLSESVALLRASLVDDFLLQTLAAVAAGRDPPRAPEPVETPSADDDTTTPVQTSRPEADESEMPSLRGPPRRPITQPAQSVVDGIRFRLNNITAESVASTASDLRSILRPEDLRWFADDLVGGRVKTEGNYHDIFDKLLLGMRSEALHHEVLQSTLDHSRRLLLAGKTRTDADRTHVKNMGAWLGRITLARNRPILARELDIKAVILEAYESGRMVVVVAFAAKLLEHCRPSTVFGLPNPWTHAILRLLREIYEVSDLKLNLKFEIELLARSLSVRLQSITRSELLTRCRRPELAGNGDFNPRAILNAALVPGIAADAAGAGGLAGSTAMSSSSATSLTGGAAPSSAMASSGGSLEASLAEEARRTVIPGLSALVPVPPSALQTTLLSSEGLRHLAAIVLDQALREQLRPIVQRHATLAVTTSRHLIAKDFALDISARRMVGAAQLMTSHLVSALVLVNAQEPLRAALSRAWKVVAAARHDLASKVEAGAMTAPLMRFLVDDNLPLACALVEKAAVSRAIKDAEDALRDRLDARAKAAETGARTYQDPAFIQPNSRWPASLPTALRPFDGTDMSQMAVYKAFDRLAGSRQGATGVPGGAAPTSGAPTSSTAASTAAGPSSLGRAVIGVPPGMSPLSAAEASAERTKLLSRIMAHVKEAGAAAWSLSDAIGGPANVSNASNPSAVRDPELAMWMLTASLLALRVEPPADRTQFALEHSRAFFALLASTVDSPLVRQIALSLLLSQRPVISAFTQSSLEVEVARYVGQEPAGRVRNVTLLSTLVAGRLLDLRQLDTAVAQMASPSAAPSAAGPAGSMVPEFVMFAAALLHRLVVSERLARPADFATTRSLLSSPSAQRVNSLVTDVLTVVAALESSPAGAPAKLMNSAAAADPSYVPGSTTAGVAPDYGVALAQAAQAAIRSAGSVADGTGAGSSDWQSVSGSASAGGNAAATPAASAAAGAAAAPSTGAARVTQVGPPAMDPDHVRKMFLGLLEEWVRVCNEANQGRLADRSYASFLQTLNERGVVRTMTELEQFVRVTVTLCVQSCAATARPAASSSAAAPETMLVAAPRTRPGYMGMDSLSKLIELLLKASSSLPNKLLMLSTVLSVITRCVLRDAEANASESGTFDQRPYLRLLANLMNDVIPSASDSDATAEALRYSTGVVTAFAGALHSLRPAAVPSFALSWQSLVCHRALLPRLLDLPQQSGWPLLHRLVIDMLQFLSVVTRVGLRSVAGRVFHRGTVRFLLTLLHDAAEFLSDYHASICEAMPLVCVQLRNLVLSAFPRKMRLPDPITPNLKVDKLREFGQPPRLLSDPSEGLPAAFASALISFVTTGAPASFPTDALAVLRSTAEEAAATGSRYSRQRISSLVLLAGVHAVGAGRVDSPTLATAPIMTLCRSLMVSMEPDGRYLLLTSIANQLRFPNSHTHLFSCIMLLLFSDATSDSHREQLTRALLERLIVHRPHPWGLLITFIELIRNPRYRFWEQAFTGCSPDISRMLRAIAKSCSAAAPQEPGTTPAVSAAAAPAATS